MTQGTRCVIDYFGYCSKPPPSARQPLHRKDFAIAYDGIGHCDKKPASCGHFLTFTEALPDLTDFTESRRSQRQNKRRKKVTA